MSDNAAAFVQAILGRAYVPDSVPLRDDLARRALLVFADNLSEAGTDDLARAIGGDLESRIRDRRNKVEHSCEEMIQLLAKEAGVAPPIADDVLCAMYEALWLVLSREQVDALIAQVPPDVARELMAAIPGQARGKF